jgi:hypothetical protein
MNLYLIRSTRLRRKVWAAHEMKSFRCAPSGITLENVLWLLQVDNGNKDTTLIIFNRKRRGNAMEGWIRTCKTAFSIWTTLQPSIKNPATTRPAVSVHSRLARGSSRHLAPAHAIKPSSHRK